MKFKNVDDSELETDLPDKGNISTKYVENHHDIWTRLPNFNICELGIRAKSVRKKPQNTDVS